jgi:hypothetical protein
MKRVIAAGMLVLGSGCASFHAFRELPQVERDAYHACTPHIATHRCAPGANCDGIVFDNYVSLPTPAERRAYLVQAGCPEVLVSAVLSGRAQIPVVPDDPIPEFKPAGSP